MVVREHLLLTGLPAPWLPCRSGGTTQKGSRSRAGLLGRPQTSVREPGQPEPELASGSPPQSQMSLAFVESGSSPALRSSDLLEGWRKDALSCECQSFSAGGKMLE